MRGFSRRLPLALLFAVATGCARNSAIDIALTLPAASTRGFAVVEFARGDDATGHGGDPFSAQWDDSTGVTLRTTPTPATPTSFTVLTEDVSRPLRIRVRFCRYDGCRNPVTNDDEGMDVPSLRYELETPFYRGQRTSWWHVIRCTPTAAATTTDAIGRCEIAGCVNVAPTTTPNPPPPVRYCRDDGTHFCQAPTGNPAPDASRIATDAGMCGATEGDAGPTSDTGPISDSGRASDTGPHDVGPPSDAGGH